MSSDDTSNFNMLQEKNQQVLNNISQLQEQEKELYATLEDVSLTPEKKQQIIQKINEISQMRMNLYAGLKDAYSYYQQNVTTSTSTLGQSMAAVNVLENELNQSKIRRNLIEDQKSNKLRLIEINTYYGKRYNAHAKLMKTLVFTFIPIIIFTVMYNKGILPSGVYKIIVTMILVIGAILIGLQLIDISNRGSMNWDEYNWYFNKDSAPTPDTIVDSTTEEGEDPWQTTTVACVGSACCYEGSTYDAVKNVCLPNANTTTVVVDQFQNLEQYGKMAYKL